MNIRVLKILTGNVFYKELIFWRPQGSSSEICQISLKASDGKLRINIQGMFGWHKNDPRNSRSLVPFASDPDDFNALTHGHFLISRPFDSILEI